MAAPEDQPKPPLHDFSLPYLKWGKQRQLRCVKSTDHNHQSTKPIINLDHSSKRVLHKHEISAKKLLKVSLFLEPDNFNNYDNSNKGGSTVNGYDESSRPWNLRTRRAAIKAPVNIEEKKINNNNYNYNCNYNIDPLKRNLESDSQERNENNTSCVSLKRQSSEKVKFCIPLSKEEIEQDFFEIARIRPPRRPKRRPRIVQKNLDSIFPGLWLSEVTADSYKVAEVPES